MYEQPKRAKLVELLNDEMGILPGYEVIAHHYLTMLCEQTKETSTVVSRKYAHPRKYVHPPFSRQVVAKGHLLLESTPTLLGKHLNSSGRSTVKEVGLRMAIYRGTICNEFHYVVCHCIISCVY